MNISALPVRTGVLREEELSWCSDLIKSFGGKLWGTSSPVVKWDVYHHWNLPAVPLSSLILETSKDWTSIISVGNVFHCSTGSLGNFSLCLLWICQDTWYTGGHSLQKTKSNLDYFKNGKQNMSKSKQTFGNRFTKRVQMHFSYYLKLSTNYRNSFRISVFKSSLSQQNWRKIMVLWYSLWQNKAARKQSRGH